MEPVPSASSDAMPMTLAALVLRSERTIARRTARQAARQRATLARCADVVAAVVLLVPWVRQGLLLRDGLQVSPAIASLALVSIALRQIVLTVVCAQPDHRSRAVMLAVSPITALVAVAAVVQVSSAATGPGERIASPFAMLLFVAASLAAAAWAAGVGQDIEQALRRPVDLLDGVGWSLPDEVSAHLDQETAVGPDTPADGIVAARILTRAAAATAAVGCVAAMAMSWATRLDVNGLVDMLGPNAGSRTALLLGGAALVVVAVLAGDGRPDRRRKAKVAGLLVAAALAGGAAVSALLAVAAHRTAVLVTGPGGWITLAAFGCASAFALLAGSALYETWHRDPLAAGDLDEADHRLSAVLRPPDVVYYVS